MNPEMKKPLRASLSQVFFVEPLYNVGLLVAPLLVILIGGALQRKSL